MELVGEKVFECAGKLARMKRMGVRGILIISDQLFDKEGDPVGVLLDFPPDLGAKLSLVVHFLKKCPDVPGRKRS
jgi:hypothetical protein